ncbi:TPA: hypothetical protein ACYLN4_000909 [Burkholderia lata]
MQKNLVKDRHCKFVVRVEVIAFSYGSAKNHKKKAKTFEKCGQEPYGEACSIGLGVGFLLEARALGFKEVQNRSNPLKPLQNEKRFAIRHLHADV